MEAGYILHPQRMFLQDEDERVLLSDLLPIELLIRHELFATSVRNDRTRTSFEFRYPVIATTRSGREKH
jgi:hypothetical protein